MKTATKTKKVSKRIPTTCPLSKCKKCVYEKYPGTKTKMVSSKLRQGMSSQEFTKVEKMVKVRCDKCYRVTWLPEAEVSATEKLTPQEIDRNRLGDIPA